MMLPFWQIEQYSVLWDMGEPTKKVRVGGLFLKLGCHVAFARASAKRLVKSRERIGHPYLRQPRLD